MTSHIAPPPDTMRAMVLTEFGGPDVLHAAELPTPVPRADEVLVEIACSSVNPADWKTREGKLSAYIDYHFPFVLGFDLAGVIAAVGPDVTRWQVGDQVFGMSNQRSGEDGTYAEYCLASSELLAPLPDGWSYVDAAGLPVAGSTAYGGMVDAGELQNGQTVLINGGAGGVGSIAIQIARALGARVAVTCSPKNFDYVSALGADLAIDYRGGDVVTQLRAWAPSGVDQVLDAVGLDTLLPHAEELVAPGGRYVEIETLISRADDERVARAAERGVRIVSNMIAIQRQPQHLTELAALCAKGAIRPPETELLPLSRVADAHRLVEAGHVRGKVILAVHTD
ncbi:quinone oxidoreductase family protein [Mycolicibacterium mucogenicum]|nr:NADP-dependent oxidoreductase [Mycolicibacterium mucogenicum]